MSKKKSMAGRRMRTRFSTGVVNYKNIELMGQQRIDPVSTRGIMRSLEREANLERHARDIDRGVDFNIVGMILHTNPLMSLADAKCEALTLTRAMQRRNYVNTM